MKRTIIAAIAALGITMLGGCNTLQGVGKDVQKAGEKIEDAAKKR